MSFVTAAVIGGSIAVAGAGTKLGMSLSGRRKRIEEQREAREQLQQREREYDSLDTSNIYADERNKFRDMENTYEDMTVNQQQAQFEAEQTQQQQANIMSELRGAAGGSGIAALAQTMANQATADRARSSASIGQQEAANQMAMAKGAQRVQEMQYAGAEQARDLAQSKQTQLLGMAMERKAQADAAREQATQGIIGGIGGVIGGAATAMAGGVGNVDFFTGGD